MAYWVRQFCLFCSASGIAGFFIQSTVEEGMVSAFNLCTFMLPYVLFYLYILVGSPAVVVHYRILASILRLGGFIITYSEYSGRVKRFRVIFDIFLSFKDHIYLCFLFITLVIFVLTFLELYLKQLSMHLLAALISATLFSLA